MKEKLPSNTICKFGKGMQDMAECRMIYIHIPGYYSTKGSKGYKDALKNLCPNYIKEGGDKIER